MNWFYLFHVQWLPLLCFSWVFCSMDLSLGLLGHLWLFWIVIISGQIALLSSHCRNVTASSGVVFGPSMWLRRIPSWRVTSSQTWSFLADPCTVHSCSSGLYFIQNEKIILSVCEHQLWAVLPFLGSAVLPGGGWWPILHLVPAVCCEGRRWKCRSSFVLAGGSSFSSPA